LDADKLSDLGLRNPCFTALDVKRKDGSSPPPLHIHSLEIRNLCVAYKKKTLLSDFSLTVSSGDILAVTGANGTGKTTLCQILAGLKKQKSGDTLFDGKKLSRRERLKHMYYVMNGSDNQLFAASVREELLLGLKMTDENARLCDKILSDFGLSQFRERHPLTLSGGQKQRLTLAVAFMRSKDIIILDEPTSGLDLQNMRLVAAAVKIAAASGKIIIIVSHDNELINFVCNKITKLD
jgi:energy-coupling factor transport system ATP-binding protein